MILGPMALELANQLIAERRTRAALDARADAALADARKTSVRERWIPRWSWR